MAVDLPSGISPDGCRGPVPRADVTVTFGAVKPGLLLGRRAQALGVTQLDSSLSHDGGMSIAFVVASTA